MTAQSRREDAVSVREDAVIVVQRCCEMVWRWFQRFPALGGCCFSRRFCRRVWAPFPSVFLGFCAVPGRDNVFSGGGLFGGFLEVEHLLHGFWVLSGGLSTVSLPIFISFRCGDQPLVPAHCSSSFLRQFLQQLGRSLCCSHFLF